MNDYERDELADEFLRVNDKEKRRLAYPYLSPWQLRRRTLRECSVSNLPKNQRNLITNRFDSRFDYED